jgi:DNA-binding NarL/FixJ family response regulator
MDMQMPNLNGYEATMTIRKEGITTPVVALTAGAMKDDDKKCFAAGCDEYLTKPIDRDKLAEVISKYFAEKIDGIAQKIDSLTMQSDELAKNCTDNKTDCDPQSQTETPQPVQRSDQQS